MQDITPWGKGGGCKVDSRLYSIGKRKMIVGRKIRRMREKK
jgi:hypothetical protein